MDSENTLNTLEKVRDNINYLLSDGVKNRKSDFRTFTLCTSGDYPSGRTVVLRGYNSDNGILTFHSNIHAEKIEQLKTNPNVCCVFYSKSKKIQIRVFGHACINHENDRSSDSWNRMSDMSKECYFQKPNPGTVLSNYDKYVTEIKEKESIAFSVIDIDIKKIDWLYLKREGHRRANLYFSNKKDDVWVSP